MLSFMNGTTPLPKGTPLDRAIAAYWRTAALGGVEQPQPSASRSDVVELGGKEYVVLRNAKDVLAVYRVRTSGVLKRLARWPKELGK